MHPIAAYCALLGLRPMKFMFCEPGSRDTGYRVRFHVQPGERHLCCVERGTTWCPTYSSAMSEYEDVDWSEIPLPYLDCLTTKIINDFLEED